MKILKYFAFTAFLLLICASYSAAFRCGTDLVTSGDTKKKVQSACGKPSLTETVCADDEIIVLSNKKSKTKKCKKKVEQWLYNCGEGDFVYVLTFEKGILIKETTASRGHGSSECGIQYGK